MDCHCIYLYLLHVSRMNGCEGCGGGNGGGTRLSSLFKICVWHLIHLIFEHIAHHTAYALALHISTPTHVHSTLLFGVRAHTRDKRVIRYYTTSNALYQMRQIFIIILFCDECITRPRARVCVSCVSRQGKIAIARALNW